MITLCSLCLACDIVGKREAVASIETMDETDMHGSAHFVDLGTAVVAIVELDNAPPGFRGLHIHDRGDCTRTVANNMGECFAPAPDDLSELAPKPLGELGTIKIDEHGHGRVEIVIKQANLQTGDSRSFLDKAIVVHEHPEMGTNHVWDAGQVIGCGRVERNSWP